MKWFKQACVLALFAFSMSGCSGCSSDVAGAGESCDASLSEACEDHAHELACLEDADGTERCLHPTGTQCKSDEELCLDGATCVDVEDDEARCLLDEASACDMDDDLCGPGLVCEAVESEEEVGHQCYAPVVVEGYVFDAESSEPVEGAQVIAFDEERSALSDVAVTDEFGEYALRIPAVRDEEGEVIQQMFTLRASAQDYQTFPGGLRQAQPIDASRAERVEDHGEEGEEGEEGEGAYVVDTAQTDIALIELPSDEQGFASLSGHVDIEGGLGGVLVVAEPEDVEFEAESAATGISAVTGLDGSFTIFNVPPGEYDLRGYIADYQIDSHAVEVDEESLENLVLVRSEEGLRDVSGQIQIVRTSGMTSVILMVASTFDATMIRGEVPAGLRAPRSGAPDVDGTWTIEGVPAGQYVVLAAFENDDLVRSPDEGIAGTDLVYLDVPAGDGDFDAGDSFKVTEALETVHPGADGPEGVSEAPTLRWGRISNADEYNVVVYDAFGNLTFEELGVEHEGGIDVYEVDYTGEFEAGMYYQFRVVSHRGDSENSSTEPLRGVFYRE